MNCMMMHGPANVKSAMGYKAFRKHAALYGSNIAASAVTTLL